MPRLYRPSIPIETKCRVVLRQLGEMFVDDVIRANRFIPRDHRKRSLGRLLDEKLASFAAILKCEVTDLRLDHDPPLGSRPRERRGLGSKTYYIPDANDPAHLFYRPHGAQFAGSHDVKTRIRGAHGQHPDIVLVKKNRRQEEREGTRPKSYKTRMREKRRGLRAKKRAPNPRLRKIPNTVRFRSPADKSKPKRKWPKRKIQSRPFERRTP